MIQIIAGEKGKGKTKVLIEKANEAVGTSNGSVVYLDKTNKNMYGLNRNLRLINVKDYFLESSAEFLGFVCGMLSQDHDIEIIFVDSFLKVACLESMQMNEFESVLIKLKMISEQFNTNFVLGISIGKDQFPASVANDIIVAL